MTLTLIGSLWGLNVVAYVKPFAAGLPRAKPYTKPSRLLLPWLRSPATLATCQTPTCPAMGTSGGQQHLKVNGM